MSKRKIQFFACMVLFALLGMSTLASAQWRKKKKGVAVTAPAADSTRKKEPPKIKPYKDVITKDMTTSRGFFTVHTSKDDKYYFELPDSLFNRDIMIVSRVSKASTEMRNGASGYAGDQIGETVYRFEKGPQNKIFMRRISFAEYAKDSSISIYAGLQKNNIMAIVEAFPVLAYSADSAGVVVDATDFLNRDNDNIYFQRAALKARAGMGSQVNERSYIKTIHTFPTNIEITAVKTYTAGLNPTAACYTVELNASLVLLPVKPMQPRYMDDRVGYFGVAHRDYETNPQNVQYEVIARRWRLEPRPEDVEKYKRGELVEPIKPIVFYIDPVTPKQWVPYLIKGVNDWQKAFEQAGFKNAIYAREAPAKEEDSTWSIDDARHAAIVYRPSEIANAMGPNVADPRSGEILESHIFWYHNVMQLLQKWYLIQCAAVDPRARKPVFDTTLMGDLVRFVSSHEVGHTLGLLHNFGSSSTVPVENLRNKAWVEAHGHTPSIMDYARFNYVAQPEDNISAAGLYPRIGDYDKWAIEWGYRWHPEYKTAEEEKLALTKVVTDSLSRNHRLWFGSEMEQYDARSQSEDLGDDAMKAGMYGIKNLQRIMPHIAEWTVVPGEPPLEMQHTYEVLFSQYARYLGHVMKNIGGIYHNVKLSTEAGPVYEVEDYARQKEAVAFICKEVLATPMWLNERSIVERLPMNFTIELSSLQVELINGLINRDRLSRIVNQEVNAKDKVYTIQEYMTDLNKGILTEIYAGKNIDIYRRDLQKIYVSRLLEEATIAPDGYTMLGDYSFHMYISDLPEIIKDNLHQLQALCKKGMQNPALNKQTKLHLKELDDKITKKLKAPNDKDA